MKAFSYRLQELLNSKGITPYQFSMKVGISQSTVSRILNKNSKPNSSSLEKICEFFNVSEEWFLTGVDKKSPIELTDFKAKPLTQKEIEFIRDAVVLNEEQLLEDKFFRKWLENKLILNEIKVRKSLDKK